MEIMNGNITIEYLFEDELYCAAWATMPALGVGTTEEDALEDLRGALHYAVDSCVTERLEKGA